MRGLFLRVQRRSAARSAAATLDVRLSAYDPRSIREIRGLLYRVHPGEICEIRGYCTVTVAVFVAAFPDGSVQVTAIV